MTLEAVDRGLATVAAAVVDDPEHPSGRGVGFCGHDLFDQPAERFYPGGRLGPPVSQRAAISTLAQQYAASSTILARITTAYGPLYERARRSSSARSSTVNTISNRLALPRATTSLLTDERNAAHTPSPQGYRITSM